MAPAKLDAMAGFLRQRRLQAHRRVEGGDRVFRPHHADKEGLHKQAIFPDGTPVTLDPERPIRASCFSQWLLRPENPSFSRVAANRVWTCLMGRGIVHSPTTSALTILPRIPELLAFLERDSSPSRCDLKHLVRVILNSRNLRTVVDPGAGRTRGRGPLRPLSPRRLEAEVLIDALNQITETKESYSSPIPEPFTFIPEGVRGIALPDGSITSSILELFGRPPRDTGYQFERSLETNPRSGCICSIRATCREDRGFPLVMGASSTKPDFPIWWEKSTSVLSRPPTREEFATLQAHAESTAADGRTFAADLVLEPLQPARISLQPLTQNLGDTAPTPNPVMNKPATSPDFGHRSAICTE